jgi:hypothetical protein
MKEIDWVFPLPGKRSRHDHPCTRLGSGCRDMKLSLIDMSLAPPSSPSSRQSSSAADGGSGLCSRVRASRGTEIFYLNFVL